MEDWGAVRDRLADAVDGVTSDEPFVEVTPADIRAALERVEELEREVIRKDHGYTAIIKMERDARDQFRDRAEAAEKRAEALERDYAEAQDVAVQEKLRAQDHHFHSRGMPVRTPDEIREHINSDHPCCIGVGDACGLLAEVARLRVLIGIGGE